MAKEYSIWDAANRIIWESLENIEDSPFEEVYRKADQMLVDMIVDDEKQSLTSRRDEQITNTISFLGRRGRGKTSAMLSFYMFLNKLQNKEICKWSKFPSGESKKFFFQLPYIDAAMLSKNEFIIDVILAKMWDEFHKQMEDESVRDMDGSRELLKKKVKEQFEKVSRAHAILEQRETSAKAGELEDITFAAELHELAISMNLKEEIRTLVKNYLQVLCENERKGYLVIAIDDVDMADGSAHRMLEQLRRFLSIPEVILFVTADYERLKNVCKAYYREQKLDDVEVHRFVNDYLEKSLPVNRRIYMPEMTDTAAAIPIDKKTLQKLNVQSKYEKDVILELFAKRSGFYFDSERKKRHFLQNDSLRSMVNYFNRIRSIQDNEYTDWLYTDLKDGILNRIEDPKQLSFARALLLADKEDIGYMLTDYLKANSYISNTVKGEGMGYVLYGCSRMEAENPSNLPFVNFVILLYSVLMGKADLETKRKLIGNSIWGEWEFRAFDGFSVRIGEMVFPFDERAQLEFKITNEIVELIADGKLEEAIKMLWDNHITDIKGWLYALLFVNINIPSSGKVSFQMKGEGLYFQKDFEFQSSKEVIEYGNISMKPQITAVKSCFGFFFRDRNKQIDVLKTLINDVVVELYKFVYQKAGKECPEGQGKQLSEEAKQYVDEMAISKEIFSEKFLQSVEIIYSIGKMLEIERLINTSDTIDLYERMKSYCMVIQMKLEEQDEYYSKKAGVITGFKEAFEDQIYVKLFMSPTSIPLWDEKIQEAFKKKFTDFFRNIRPVTSLTLPDESK